MLSWRIIMREFFTTSVMFFLLLTISCSKEKKYQQKITNGVKITINSSQPTKPEMKIIIDNADSAKPILPAKIKSEDSLKSTAITLKLHKSITFQSDSNFIINSNQYLEWNGSNRYYLADSKTKKIAVFDQYGKRLNIFGGNGQGPGGFIQQCYPIYWQDTLFVPDARTRKINKFDKNGSFISFKLFQSSTVPFPGYIHSMNDKIMLINSSRGRSSEKYNEMNDILLFDRNFSYLKTLYSCSFEGAIKEVNLEFARPVACLNNNNTIYLFKGSKDKYEIECLDMQGKKLAVIRKEYRKHLYPDSIIDKWSKSINLKYIGNTRDAVEKMLSDGKGRLWVRSPGDEKFGEEGYDVFVDGVFMQRVKLLPEMLNGFRFVENYLLTFNNNIAKIYEVR